MENINPLNHPLKHVQEMTKDGEKIAICRCWQSKKFPLCDGAHAKLNLGKKEGKVGPFVVSVKVAEEMGIISPK